MAATKAKSSKPVPMPIIGRQGPSGSAKKSGATPKGKEKANGNIMSFFKKPEQETGLFVADKRGWEAVQLDETEVPEPAVEDEAGATGAETRFNENGGSIKRRKTEDLTESQSTDSAIPSEELGNRTEAQQRTQKRVGPFLEESDSEDEDEQPEALIGMNVQQDDSGTSDQMRVEMAPRQEPVDLEEPSTTDTRANDPKPAPLIKQETSCGPENGDFKDFEGMDDFDEDPFEEGDEYMERRYMEEQARLEAEAEEDEKDYDPLPQEEGEQPKPPGEGPMCPICSIGLAGASEQDAGVHVNNCLDGNPTPLPERKQLPSPAPTIKSESTAVTSANAFRKPNRGPKPGQADPFAFGKSSTNGGSAFNKLMSGHAEDAAWAEAAASEHSSRGKPSYQRLFICVDAFRYGAVQGCQAYFLSHFHSDHYIGLTSTWSHGPIYCSKVTGNLVRQQLRVDPKYVIDLEFEKTVDVPNTKGVKVTMISANHCPGSSLYLFEKVVGKKQNGEPRLQRILHCGDFRACRKHVEHPLLMPNVQDVVTGKTKEQKLDVCYLDTTYLTPKYAFPSQENVIKACADMCLSLSKHSVDDSDGWEQMKRQRAGEGMAKFVRKESNPEIKEEPSDEDDTDGMKLEKNPNGSQQVFSTSLTPNVQQGRGRLLVVVGTYSIGKERICLGIARALNSKIYAPPAKQRIVAALEDPELGERMTNDPRLAQVHMTPLFEIRAETLDDYLKDHFPHFTRAVGFRPSGWNYRPPNSRFTDSPTVQTVLYSDNWKSTYSMKDLVPQRGSSSRASCFGVPYSEHSSFRELTMFCTALRIDKVIPTVNVGSQKSRERMKAWCERWATERRKNGLFQLPEDGSW
ncbi:DNA cross-link repair protein PSO2/SNM1 [Vermiconidia calcicola]|uniref:DNA cross-link repair protein PSO2/SNM1 n=1 Tax=Vermiconidia calcicola TaxID=1690605 RepID=A0ACC3ME63_9PEZI|nr:DNA cross-link repair protein PSO2/SNM1 [Vermiconidia calcicola]